MVLSPSNIHGLGGFRNPNDLFALLCLVCNEGLAGRERPPSVGVLEGKIRDVRLGSQDFVLKSCNTTVMNLKTIAEFLPLTFQYSCELSQEDRGQSGESVCSCLDCLAIEFTCVFLYRSLRMLKIPSPFMTEELLGCICTSECTYGIVEHSFRVNCIGCLILTYRNFKIDLLGLMRHTTVCSSFSLKYIIHRFLFTPFFLPVNLFVLHGT